MPLLDWLDGLRTKARQKCVVKIELLEAFGYDLRRPHCDLLEQGIYELRARLGHVNYRILYFFKGTNVVIVSHGCSKEQEVPRSEINRAIGHRDKYLSSPEAHTYKGVLQ